MTIDDLREELKAVFNRHWKNRNVQGVTRGAPMHEYWKWAWDGYVALDMKNYDPVVLNVDGINKEVYEFARLGYLYYLAKREGIQAAVLAKLSDNY